MSFPRIERRAEVLTTLQISTSTLYVRIKEGLWPKPISLGVRAVGWISSENNQVLSAMATGQSEFQIKLLVQSLVEKRAELFKANIQ
jgi:prophage regulatory protein